MKKTNVCKIFNKCAHNNLKNRQLKRKKTNLNFIKKNKNCFKKNKQNNQNIFREFKEYKIIQKSKEYLF